MTGFEADVLPRLAFYGGMGSGKTTLAEMAAKYFGYGVFHFAGPLKDIASYLWGEEARTDRNKLQKLGVAVREIEENTWADLLVRRIEDLPEVTVPLSPPPGYYSGDITVPSTIPLGTRAQRVCVDDLRFPNEWWALKAAGFKIVRVTAAQSNRIERLQRNGKLQDVTQLAHESETALDDGFLPDYSIHNDTVEESYGLLVDIIQREAR